MYHKVIIIGNLTAQPVMRFTPGGTAVTNITVATSTKISKEKTPECPKGWKEGYQGKNWEQTIFFKVSIWRGIAEAVNQYCAKGSQVYIEGTMNGETENGTMNPRTWTSRDGDVRANFEVTARVVKFLSRSGSGQQEEGSQEAPADFVEEDLVPF